MKDLLFIFAATVAVTALFHSSLAADDGAVTDLDRRQRQRRGQEIKSLSGALPSFQDATEGLNLPRRPPGLVIVPSIYDFGTTFDLLKYTLENDADTSPILESVDHAALAVGVTGESVTLQPNTLVFFSTTRNPIIEKNIVASLDCPHRMLIWEDENGECFVGYNSQQFLAARYADVADNEIDQIMARVASAATGTQQDAFMVPSEDEVRRYRNSSQILIKDSLTSFISTWNRLSTFLEKNEVVKPTGALFVVDNSRDTLKAAVAVFGYAIPNTLLLQNDPTAGLDLPLRISVTEDANGLVQVATNSQAFLDKRYDLVQAPTEIKESLKDVVLFIVNHAAGAYLPVRSDGMVLATSTRSTFDEAYNNLQLSLASVGTVMAEVDNSPLDGFNKVLYVSFPELDGTIMAAHPRAALDLPHAVSIWQADDGSVYVAFNAPRYIGSRFVPNGMPDAWDVSVQDLLSTAVSIATDANPLSFLVPEIREFLRIRGSPGHLILRSDVDFDATVSRLLSAISAFGLEKVYDVGTDGGGDANISGHRSRVIGFRFGTALEDRLLADSKCMGIDLPWKILVVDMTNLAGGAVNVMTNDIEFLKERHNLSAAVKVRLDNFSEILDTILDATVNAVF